jgi:hypothetical protein
MHQKTIVSPTYNVTNTSATKPVSKNKENNSKAVVKTTSFSKTISTLLLVEKSSPNTTVVADSSAIELRTRSLQRNNPPIYAICQPKKRAFFKKQQNFTKQLNATRVLDMTPILRNIYKSHMERQRSADRSTSKIYMGQVDTFVTAITSNSLKQQLFSQATNRRLYRSSSADSNLNRHRQNNL